VPRLRVLGGGLRLARLSPVDALRLSGAARMLARIDGEAKAADAGFPDGKPEGYMMALDSLTKAFGYGEGGVFERARRMFEDTR
jgi:hypothetical protein